MSRAGNYWARPACRGPPIGTDGASCRLAVGVLARPHGELLPTNQTPIMRSQFVSDKVVSYPTPAALGTFCVSFVRLIQDGPQFVWQSEYVQCVRSDL